MRSRQLPFYLAAAAGGAALAYYLDSQQGRRRRHVTRDKALSLAKHGTKRGRKLVHHVSADARGFVERARHARGSAGETDDGDGYEHRSLKYQKMVRAVIEAQRAEIVRLRDTGIISNEVMHRLERELDLEDERLEI